MRIELQRDDDVKVILDILFWKTAPGERRIVNGRELIDTTCQVSRVMYEDRPMTLITKAEARQNPLDNYNKIVGKKVALAKAIANLTFLKPIPFFFMGDLDLSRQQCNNINIRRRSMRQHIWNVFHQTFGRWN